MAAIIVDSYMYQPLQMYMLIWVYRMRMSSVQFLSDGVHSVLMIL